MPTRDSSPARPWPTSCITWKRSGSAVSVREWYLFHYSDLLTDLPGQLRRLAGELSIDVTDERIEQFAAAATFDRMKERADELAPKRRQSSIWRSNQDFFHRGHDGQWRDLLDDEGLRRYEHRVAELVPTSRHGRTQAG